MNKKTRNLLILSLTLAAVTAGTADKRTYRLHWNATANATGYELQVAPDQEFKTLSTSAKPTAAEAKVELETGKYVWRVRALDQDGKAGEWSTPAELVDMDPASQPVTKDGGETAADRQPVETHTLPPGKSLVLRFSGTDTGSGMGEIYARINDGKDIRLPAGELRLRDDGAYQVTFFAIDRAGNRSVPKFKNILIDSTPPDVRPVVEGSARLADGSVAAAANLALNGRDAGTGVASLEWRPVGQAEWKAYAGPIPLKDVGNSAIIEYQAKDKMGNKSAGFFTFRIKSTAPNLPALCSTEKKLVPAEGIAVKGIEPGATLEYKLNDSNFARVMNGEFIKFAADGEYNVALRISDQLGNTAEGQCQVIVDRIAPDTKVDSSVQ